MADPKKRSAFFKQVKDTALDYLMRYLPHVEVPSIKGSKDGVNYQLDNITLSGFTVPADKVSLLVVKGTELHLRADHIVFDVRGIKWNYQQTYFPYLSGEGLVDCMSKRTKIMVVFRSANLCCVAVGCAFISGRPVGNSKGAAKIKQGEGVCVAI